MESLPDAIVQHILSLISNARDVASCNCVSKRWKDSTPYLRSLFFSRGLFDRLSNGSGDTPDAVLCRMISYVVKLEELVVYCPFTSSSLASWLSSAGCSLSKLELRLDNISDHDEIPSKLDCLRAAGNLESLKLWGVLMVRAPKWDVFDRLKNLEIVGARLANAALSYALHACPNLTYLLLRGCEGLTTVLIDNPYLKQCKLDFFGAGDCSLEIESSKLELLEVQGCSYIRVPETSFLKDLSIANNSGRVRVVEFGMLAALDMLSMRGVQWHWSAISKMLHMANKVKNLYMKVEFTGDSDVFHPFPEIDFVDFFNSHPKLHTFDMHGAMFAALCQRDSLKNVDSRFDIPALEEVVITVRSPLNAEQKMSTLESLIKYAKNLRKMRIKILQMKSCHSSSDDFFDDICKFRRKNRRIVSIE
ncbi:F-box protein At1g10780 [Andrographis paniculata]|uniref:F-box protein At1g10780 n=1 Tax=Andrographis paniculata TaxID=175694 RepID=UPI0021E812F8|nr:F-box protein At1g10780 [Andrographis paniculata]